MLHCTALIRNVYCTITEGSACMDIRQYWKPQEEVVPMKKGLCLRPLECIAVKELVPEIGRVLPKLDGVVPCYMQSHHILTRVKLVGSSRNHTFYVQRKMVRCAKTQTLFVQMSLSDVDSVRARNILSMQMAVLSLSYYTQPLNNRIFIVHDYFFDNTSFCHANTNFTRQ